MIVGFTGTSRGMTTPQIETLKFVLRRLRRNPVGIESLHHGDCVEADEKVDGCARELGIPVVIHPPSDPRKRAFKAQPGDVVWEPRPYLERNHDIVDEADLLIACPGEEQERLRSGTWATVRYARKSGHGLNVLLIYPDGRYEGWRPEGATNG